MIITGRIFDIVHVSDTIAKIILRKKDRGKYELAAITVIGWWRDKAINELQLKPKDKIKANIRIRSKEVNGKYYTDVICREIYVVENSSGKYYPENTLFDEETGEVIDDETGEIL